MKRVFLTTAAISAALQLSGVEIPVCTYDKLSNEEAPLKVEPKRPLSAKEKDALAGKQPVLCMVGDSVTWAQAGDHFRGEMLKLMPYLAFAGTHTGILGYSHAGEGGDSTRRLLQRVSDPERIPDAPYYHLLIGVNDAGGAKKDERSAAVADATVDRIRQIVDILLKKKGVRKVFLGSILPSPFGKNGESTVRERTASLINAKLRAQFNKLFPAGKVVWIEYEKPLRAQLESWKKRENLRGAHPTAKGYKIVAALAVPVLKKEMSVKSTPQSQGAVGVEVVNLWNSKTNSSAPLLPGWYTLSMELDNCGETAFTLYSTSPKVKACFKKSYRLKGKPGSRVQVNFMTGYQGYGYDRAPFKINFTEGKAVKLQIEKTRPLQRASIYGTGRFIDTVSPVAAGEILLRK